jgi:hypothetical protein
MEKQELFNKLLQTTPDKAAVRYNLALDYARLGDLNSALATLKEALLDTPWLDPSADAQFKGLSGNPDFDNLVHRVQAKHRARCNSLVTITISQRDLIPEGLAADPSNGVLFLGSIYRRKILKIKPDGITSDFVGER